MRRVQEWLSLRGCATAVDGDFGEATRRAVGQFQQRVGLNPTGTADSVTWQALIRPLTRALAPLASPSRSLASTVLRVAKQHLIQSPIEVGGDNRGPWVRVYCDGNDGPEWLWCAGFVTFVLKQACLSLDRPMPLQGSMSCDSLAYQAKELGLFVNGKDISNRTIAWGELGAAQVFLVRRGPSDWTHTGFAFAPSDQTFATIEGNTNDDGSPNGYAVCRRTRSIGGKDLIRLPD